MPGIAALLKQEITRLARKEAKAHTEALRRSNAQYRRDIALLKRQVGGLLKQVSFLEQQERGRVAKGPSKADVEGKRFSPAGLKAHRERLGLSAADYGKLVGVTGQTVYNWENGKSRPADEQFAAVVALRELGKRAVAKRLDLLER